MTENADIALGLLHGEAREMEELQRVLEAAPAYAQLATGSPPGPADAQSLYTVLPPGKGYEDKFVFAIDCAGLCAGAIDVIRGYPRPDTAMLGLLLIAEPFQRRGIGSAAYALLEARIRAWGPCDRVRIGVLETNRQVTAFWLRLGFVFTGERKPYRYASVVSETVVLEKPLR